MITAARTCTCTFTHISTYTSMCNSTYTFSCASTYTKKTALSPDGTALFDDIHCESSKVIITVTTPPIAVLLIAKDEALPLHYLPFCSVPSLAFLLLLPAIPSTHSPLFLPSSPCSAFPHHPLSPSSHHFPIHSLPLLPSLIIPSLPSPTLLPYEINSQTREEEAT